MRRSTLSDGWYSEEATPLSEKIGRVEMMQLLLEATPSFEPVWHAFCAEWPEEPERPYYGALADLVRHLSAVMAQGNVRELVRVFAVLERLIQEGDEYVENAAIVGLIEDLQNENLHDGTNPSQFLPFLLPQSRYWWEKVDDFWMQRLPLIPPNYEEVKGMTGLDPVIANWIEAVSTKNKLPETCRALLVGLFEGASTYQAYLVGSNEYDPKDDDWACNQDFTPEPRYLDTGLALDTPWETVLTAVVKAVSSILAGGTRTILHESPHVSVGFDEGDLVPIK